MKPRAVRNSRFDLPNEFTRALINFLIRHVYVYFTRTNSTNSFGIFFLFSFKNFQRDVYVPATKSVDTPVTVISYFFFVLFLRVVHVIIIFGREHHTRSVSYWTCHPTRILSFLRVRGRVARVRVRVSVSTRPDVHVSYSKNRPSFFRFFSTHTHTL